MPNPLYNVPGLGGFVAAKEAEQEQTARSLGTAAQVLTLRQALDRQAQADAFRRDVSALGANPGQEAIVGVANKYADPDTLLKMHQASLDRQQAVQDRALQFAQTLDLKQQQLDQAREAAAQRAQDAASRQAFEQFYKTETLKNQQAANALQGQLRTMGLEIQKQGNELRVMQFDANKRAQEERTIEGQVGKTADRMKDLGPVLSAGRQLNDLLSMYTPQDVPGVGYLKNTDMGKFFLSDKGKDVSASVKLFGNSVLKAMSGQAVTPNEEIRQMAAQMADGRFSARDFYIAWPKMATWLNDQTALATSGLTPPARERFVDRTGMKLEPLAPRFFFDQASGKLIDTQRAGAAPAPSAAPAGIPPPPPGFTLNR